MPHQDPIELAAQREADLRWVVDQVKDIVTDIREIKGDLKTLTSQKVSQLELELALTKQEVTNIKAREVERKADNRWVYGAVSGALGLLTALGSLAGKH